MHIPAVLKTTAARLTGLYLLLFAACAVALVVYMTSVTVGILESQTRQTVNEEALSLARAYERAGLPGLVRTVEQRSRQPGAYLYLIADPNGRILAGNVESLDPGILDIDGWTELPFAYRRYGEGSTARTAQPQTGDQPAQSQAPSTHRAIALVLRMPNQMIVLVGRDLGEPERFRSVVSSAMMFALGMMGVGAFAIWFLVGRQALKRIDSISDASRRIMGGDLAGRLPVTGSGDEFDRLSQNLNAMLARIAQLNEGLKQVSDNIAHDLKTPLTRLRNRAEAALATADEAADYRGALEGTIAESDQLIRTFNAILMISRLEAGYSAELTDLIDLTAIARDVFELYEPSAEEEGIELKLAVPEAPATLIGNRELVGQALSNIVDNALKYARAGEPLPQVAISVVREGDLTRVTVADNGPGIPEQDRERATERFVRLEQSRSEPGSGLGLSLARAVMTFHGGRLDLSDAGPGLKVEMVFPAREAS